ncbi:MAG TPA: PQQ-binding-like beta-propeller repeat protein [Streptosporangiaceae bacterium]|jgi:polyvinyl alcohol dehydrogenase (cytochrome)|nr:PQQ-binding-like beta-propeller repeat protein [Streptosporangiaceae bacterium]
MAVIAVVAATGGPAWGVTAGNWPAYLGGAAHTSYDGAEQAITPANVSGLVQDWHFVGGQPTLHGQPAPGFLASPVVYGNSVYIGSNTGWFYKLSAATGTVLAKRYIGFIPGLECGAAGAGFIATATVAVDPATNKLMVYAAGADGVLFAMYAVNLNVKWRAIVASPSKTVSSYYQWSSPTVTHGRVYIGISSHCGKPAIRGGLAAFNQSTGRRVATFYSLPAGQLGGSVWSSAAVGSGGDVYASTGNPAQGTGEPAFSDALVRLAPKGLRPLASFQVPKSQVVADGDFGASPSLFGRHVAVCNKNGVLYVLNRSTLKLVWWKRIGASFGKSIGIGRCISAAAYDGRRLYIGADQIRVNGTLYRGSITALDPATGRRLWITGLPNSVLGTPSVDGAGVIAVGTYDTSKVPNAVYLVNARTGQILRTLLMGGYDFAQSAFAQGRLFVANTNGLYAFGLRRSH